MKNVTFLERFEKSFNSYMAKLLKVIDKKMKQNKTIKSIDM